MAFVARQNKLLSQQPQNRAFGRGQLGQPDHAKIEQKLTQQEIYKQELQRQIMEKQARKKMELEKIRREDQKFMKEVEEETRRENQRKNGEREKERERARKYEDPTQSPPQKKQPNPKQQKQSQPPPNPNPYTFTEPSVPKLPQLTPFFPLQPSIQTQPRQSRPYLYEQSQQYSNYYEQRIRKHKEQMNMKLDELSQHINSTKDNIRADQEIEKIRRRLRGKQGWDGDRSRERDDRGELGLGMGMTGGGGESRMELEFQNKFFSIPKKNHQVYRGGNQGKSRVLDYQSTSKFTAYNKIGDSRSQTKTRTQNDDLYSLPDDNYQNGKAQKWGKKPGKDNFLANRQAIDYQAESILGRIDDFLGKLKA